MRHEWTWDGEIKILLESLPNEKVSTSMERIEDLKSNSFELNLTGWRYAIDWCDIVAGASVDKIAFKIVVNIFISLNIILQS